MSVFQLKQSVRELESSNNDITKQSYIQVPCSKDISGDNFSNGSQFYDVDTSGNRWWVPSRSYFRVRCRLTKKNGDALKFNDGVAPAYNLGSTLWQSQECRIGGVAVSSTNEFVAQVDTMANRIEKSRSWTKSVGLSTNFLDENFDVRRAQVSEDGSLIAGITGKEETKETLRSIGIPATATIEVLANQGYRFADAVAFTDTVEMKVGQILASPGTNSVVITKVVFAADKKSFVIDVLPAPFVGVAPVTADYTQYYIVRTETVEGEQSRRVKEFEIVYQPALGIFDYEGALPCSARFVMNPLAKNQIQLSAIEWAPTNTAEGKLEIVDCFLYACMLDGPSCSDSSFYLDLKDTRLQQNKISNKSFTQRTFDIRPSCKAVTLAFQDARAGSDHRVSPTKFKLYSGNAIDPQDLSKDVGLTLNRMYFQYAGSNYPSATDTDPAFDRALGIDLSTRMYMDTLLQTGGYFDSGGAEDIQTWQKAGAYYHQKIYKDVSDRSTRLTLYTAFAKDLDLDNSRALIFDQASSVVKIIMHNGQVKSCEVVDM